MAEPAATVTLHSKPGCAHCDSARALLTGLGLAYTEVKYSPAGDGYAARRDALFRAHSHFSFPHVIVDGAFLGGFAELKAAHASGRLDAALTAAGLDLSDNF